jgi:putative spermidine/putrescine transport system substrate-binding protein
VLTAPNWVSLINYGTVLVYNKDVFPDPATAPSSMNDLFDTTKFPDAKRCMFDGAQYGWNLEYALQADGVAPEDIYTTLGTPEGLQRAFAKMDKIKNNIVYWATGAESVQFILDGQCDMGTTWNGRPALRIKDEPDLPLGVSWKGALLDGDPFGIPTSVEGGQFDAALSALAYALQPVSQCDLENELAYGQIMSVEPFPGCLTDFAKVWGPQPADMLPFPPDPQFWADHATAYLDAWTTWKTGS